MLLCLTSALDAKDYNINIQFHKLSYITLDLSFGLLNFTSHDLNWKSSLFPQVKTRK